MSTLLSPYSLRRVTLRNRIVMSPMCQYSAGEDGQVTDWHLVHYGSRAAGGVGLVMVEATAVEPRGRISTQDLGLYDPRQLPGLRRLVEFIHSQGAAAGIQIAHAGRKAFSASKGRGPQHPVAPSAVPFAEGWIVPHELSADEMDRVEQAFVQAARWAAEVGFDVLELHAAHGYLLHEFLSPLSNRRADEHGGSLEGRMRFPLRVARAVREAWPQGRPMLVRLSTTDGIPGGFDVEQAVVVARALQEAGVDAIDCSSGGMAGATVPEYPGFNVPAARRLRHEAKIPTIAVGLITRPEHAEAILRQGDADLVALGRALLREPHWPLHAARTLGDAAPWPRQYLRAKERVDL